MINYEGQGIRSMLGGTILRQITKNNTTKRDRNYFTAAVLDSLYLFDEKFSSIIKQF